MDGFNLYYRAVLDTPWRWLDLRALALQLLGPAFTLHRIRYFTAHIKAQRDDPQKYRRQQVYLRALKTIPELVIHKGHFLSNPMWLPLSNSAASALTSIFRLSSPHPGDPPLVKVIKTEEKGSDANLAAYLTRDAAKRDCKAAFVITGDSDFAGVIQMVRQDFNFPVHVVDPKGESKHLPRAATTYQLLKRSLLPQCQFPDTLSDRYGLITRPKAWRTSS